MVKILFYTFICLSSFGQSSEEDNQLLWEISGNGLESNSYLFGSLHSNDKRLFWLPDSVYVALESVESIALETDVFAIFRNHDVRTGSARLNYDKNGVPYTTSNKSSRTAYGDEDGMPQFLDAYFQQYCYNSGKHFSALETVEFQLGLLSGIEIPDWTKFRLNSELSTEEDMIEMYLEGDIHKLNATLKSNFEYIPKWYDKLIVSRNVNMSAKLDSLLADRAVFCAVGAGHLAGESGMLALLKNKGYSLRKVNHSISAIPMPEKNSVMKAKFYEYVNDSVGFKAQFYGKPAEMVKPYEEYELKLIYQDLGQGNSYCIEIYGSSASRSIDDIAMEHLPSPNLSPYKKYLTDSGGEYVEGLADAYPEGVYWSRIVVLENHFLVLKAYGGNKFMNSRRAQRFFDQVSIVD